MAKISIVWEHQSGCRENAQNTLVFRNKFVELRNARTVCVVFLFCRQRGLQIVTLSKYGHDARYLSSVSNRYPAVYVASYMGRKSEARKCQQRDLQGFRLFCCQFVE